MVCDATKAPITASGGEETFLSHSSLGIICSSHRRETLSSVNGHGLKKVRDSENCESCRMTNSVRDVRPRVVHDRCKAPEALVHSDVVVPMNIAFFGGAKYNVTLYDELSETLWAKAVSTANLVRNRTYSSAVTTRKTPFEAVWKRRPNMSHVRIFCMCRIFSYS